MLVALIIFSVICGIIWLKSIDGEGNVSGNGKFFGWGCLILAAIALYSYSENAKTKSSEQDAYVKEQINFGSSDGFRHYPCPVGGCLCTTYEPKGIYNSYCDNCGHPKHKSKYD